MQGTQVLVNSQTGEHATGLLVGYNNYQGELETMATNYMPILNDRATLLQHQVQDATGSMPVSAPGTTTAYLMQAAAMGGMLTAPSVPPGGNHVPMGARIVLDNNQPGSGADNGLRAAAAAMTSAAVSSTLLGPGQGSAAGQGVLLSGAPAGSVQAVQAGGVSGSPLSTSSLYVSGGGLTVQMAGPQGQALGSLGNVMPGAMQQLRTLPQPGTLSAANLSGAQLNMGAPPVAASLSTSSSSALAAHVAARQQQVLTGMLGPSSRSGSQTPSVSSAEQLLQAMRGLQLQQQTQQPHSQP